MPGTIWQFTMLLLGCIGFLIVTLLVTHVWIMLRVLIPLRRLAQQASAISAGNLDAMESECGGVVEIQLLRRSMAGMARHVRRSHTQSRAISDALAEGQEAERARLARELHDDTVQSFIAIGQSIDLARQFAAKDKDRSRADSLLKTARLQTVESANRLRRLIADLRPPALEELGLPTAIEMQMDALREERKKEHLHIKVKVNGVVRRLSPMQELALFRGVQEAANNAIRHGDAKRLKVTLDYQPEHIVVTVQDEGRGFALPNHSQEDFLEDLIAKRHYGLTGIRERMQQLGGKLHIDSTPGQGTTLRFSLPVYPVNEALVADTVQDPVCSALLKPHQAYGSIEYNNTRYYFCCPVCQGAFLQEPEAYLNTQPG